MKNRAGALEVRSSAVSFEKKEVAAGAGIEPATYKHFPVLCSTETERLSSSSSPNALLKIRQLLRRFSASRILSARKVIDFHGFRLFCPENLFLLRSPHNSNGFHRCPLRQDMTSSSRIREPRRNLFPVLRASHSNFARTTPPTPALRAIIGSQLFSTTPSPCPHRRNWRSLARSASAAGLAQQLTSHPGTEICSPHDFFAGRKNASLSPPLNSVKGRLKSSTILGGVTGGLPGSAVNTSMKGRLQREVV